MKSVRNFVTAFLMPLLVAAVPNTANAAASYAAGFRSGFSFACETCAAATNGAMATISSAILASETAILAATGVVPPNPTIGFPALQDTISGAEGQQTQILIAALEAYTKNLIVSLQALPANRKALTVERKLAQADLIGDKAGCAAVDYGLASGMNGASSLSEGWLWMKGAAFTDSAPSDTGTPSAGSASTPTNSSAVTSEAGTSALIANFEDQALNRVGSQFRKMRTVSGKPDAGVSEMLKPELLISEGSRVLSETPDEFGISDSERMDFLIQYLVIDTPSMAEAIMASASTPGLLKLAVPESIGAMESGMAMAVMDKIIKDRRRHPGKLGAETYLREVMAESAPDDAVSEDDFTYLTTHYRSNDPEWIARIDISDAYAVKQYAQMEAEQLARKYKTWVLKRDTIIMLSQILANTLESEKL